MKWLGGRAGRWLAMLVMVCFPTLVPADEALPGHSGVGIFDVPKLAVDEAVVLSLARSGDPERAAAALDALIAKYPGAARLRVTRALLAIAADDGETAVGALLQADELGAAGLRALLFRQEFSGIADDPRLAGLADRPASEAAPVTPALVREGEAPVNSRNTGWDPDLGRLVARFVFPPILQTHAFAANPPPGPYSDLQRLVARGQAAGNVGDLYDNRDRGHSALKPGKRTQLSSIVYSAEARAAGVDYGLNTQILFEAPTFGNSSTAIQGPLWRSQARLALTTPGGPLRLWQLYANNHLYVFPEHNDHDPVAQGGHDDLIPAATPYMLVSQGSSGSDLPFLRAVQSILAAFRPEVKAKLVEEKLIAPMVQQIFRRGQNGLGEGGYSGPQAHPSVFRAEDIDVAEMIRLAQELKADEIPPMVTVRMLREAPPDPSIFADGLTEVLFDTPAAIARVWRGAQARRQFEIEAQAEDPNGRPVTFHWKVVRGNPTHIAVEPLGETAARVRITLSWQEPMPVPGRSELTSPRVDIAVFANNGAQLSAPAFFSMLYPAHQVRVYADDRPLSIAQAKDRPYADPLIWPRRDWKDSFEYDPEGRLLGWTRTRIGNKGETRFTAHGLEVLKTDTKGRAMIARKLEYPLTRAADGTLAVTPTPTEQRFRYAYVDDSDSIGRPTPVPNRN